MPLEPIYFSVAGWLAAYLIGYRVGVNSQKEGQKNKAKTELFTAIDKLAREVPSKPTLRDIFRKEKETISDAEVAFASHLSKKKKRLVDEALTAYLTLDINEVDKPVGPFNKIPQAANPQRVAIERQAMLDGLRHLRETAEKA